jgi:hypothetical protein
MAAANAFLPSYLSAHNQRFAIASADVETAHQGYAGSAVELSRICALHETRKLSKELVLSFNKQRYILQTAGAPRYALRGQEVTVVRYADGRVEVLHGDEILPFKVFGTAKPATSPVDEKTINARVDDIVKYRWSEKSRPAPRHPWRRYPIVRVSGGGQLATP